MNRGSLSLGWAGGRSPAFVWLARKSTSRRDGIPILPVLPSAGFCAAVLCLLTASDALAQDVDKALERQRDVQSDLYQQRLERRPIPPAPRAAGACIDTSRGVAGRDLPPSAKAPERTDPMLVLEKLDIRGVTVLSPEELREIEDRHTGRPVRLFATIDAVIADITALYVEEGYVLARTYIPPDQNVRTGALVFQVIEVEIDRIDIYENDIAREDPDTTFPSLEGRPFNLRDVEQGLDQINRLPSKRARIDIVPTDRTDATRIKVCTDSKTPWRVTSQVNNFGSRSTGERQFEVSFQADDLIGAYEAWDFLHKRDAERNRPGTESSFVSGALSIPYGYWTGHLSASRHEYLTTLEGRAQDFTSKGAETNLTGRLQRVFHRDERSVSSVSATLGKMYIENFIENVRLFTGSRVLTVVGAGVDHRRALLGGSFYGALGLSRGVGWFGALEDDDPRRDMPHAQFWKLDLDINYFRDIIVDDWSVRWTARAVAQWAPQGLYNSEHLFVGGRQTVRGFREDSLGGEVGGFVGNGLTYPLPIEVPGALGDAFGRLHLTVGLDIGKISQNFGTPSEEGVLSGAAVTIAAAGGAAIAEATWEWGLSAPSSLSAEDEVFRFKLGVAF